MIARRWIGVSVVLLGVSSLTGCASKERAFVSYSYVVEPSKGLPQGMNTLYIAPAKIGPTTDEKWSELSANILRSLVNESRSDFGTPIEISDRRDTQVTFDEADLQAAGMSDRRGGQPGKLLGADGAILSYVDVKITLTKGKQRTLSDLGLFGGGGHGYGAGGADIRTSEVETVTRNMTVQTSFKLVDTANNKVWEHYLPTTFTATDRTKASPIFGSSKTEAELTPSDKIIATLVEQGARQFVSRLMRCRIQVDENVSSSGNENCRQGVRLLRAEAWGSALDQFKLALAADPGDDRAAFGAGVALEAEGRPGEALRYYQQALQYSDRAQYREARERVKAYEGRVTG
ncbi:MAG: hypothetical protein J5J06_03625 [Phycisphaerae bacterium]|nr:hypothetical protein [Phycisphaerae bacterium]